MSNVKPNSEDRGHAILSPSASSRWLSCTPSARLEAGYPRSSSKFADEGTAAHNISEAIIKVHLDGHSPQATADYLRVLAIEQAKGFGDAAMLEYCADYARWVIERYNEALHHTKDALIFLEQQLDLTEYIPQGYGHLDVSIIADGVLDIIDLKYGKGVEVSAVENKQMMLYALGALKQYDYLYDLKVVRMTIYQPRLHNYSTYEMPYEALIEWAEKELKPRAEMAFKGEGEFVAGSHCTFCKAKATCRELAEYNMQLATFNFLEASKLNNKEIAFIISRAKQFTDWLGAVEDYALAEAIKGTEFDGYKLVEGRTNRKFSDEAKVVETLTKEGYTEDQFYKKSLIGIGDTETLVGKKNITALLGEYIVKPAGKPSLVPVSDKRAVYSNTEAAAKAFEGLEIPEE
jgi:hypothetical protein